MSYQQLVDHYLENCLILNNDIITETQTIGYWDLYNGTDYDEEEDYYYDVFQYFIIDPSDAERLAQDTDEIIYYNEKLNLYVLGVTHYGTMWSSVETNYKITTDIRKYLDQESEDQE